MSVELAEYAKFLREKGWEEAADIVEETVEYLRVEELLPPQLEENAPSKESLSGKGSVLIIRPELIQEALKDNAIQKKDLAKAAGISAPYVSLLSRGIKTRASREVVKKICRLLEIDFDDLTKLKRLSGNS